MSRPAALLIAFASPAAAGVGEVVENHILPGYVNFAERSAALARTAREDCTAPAVRPAYQEAFDAWLRVAHIRFGPVEDNGRALAIAFWPDTRGATEGAIRGLIADRDPVVDTPEAFAEVSVAARGFFALDRLLYDAELSDYGADDYQCALTTAISTDLARMADAILAQWRSGYADTLRSAGSEGNATFLSKREAAQVLFTALTAGLEFDADQRLGRPLGTFERPRPARAEAWRSGRSLRNAILSLEAMRELAVTLSDAPPIRTLAAFDAALTTARDLEDPVFAGVETPQGRLKVEVLQQKVAAVREAVAAEIGPQLGVAAGFNSADGD